VVDPDHATRHGVVEMDASDRVDAHERVVDAQQAAGDAYRDLRERGVPAEDARVVLGMGTQINMTMTANLRTVLHVLNLRESAGDAQWEIRGITGLLEEALRSWAPLTLDLWDEHGPVPDGP
jgi:thymidylate synthase (FAD)